MTILSLVKWALNTDPLIDVQLALSLSKTKESCKPIIPEHQIHLDLSRR